MKIVLVFCVIFAVSKFLKNWIALAIFSGALFSGLFFGHGIFGTLKSFFLGSVSQNAVFLALLVTLISIFSGVMEVTGTLERCKKASVGMFSSGRAAGVFMASLIGLLPMPGGALFSAPLVNSSIEGKNNPGLLTALNYWFRHVWEFWWPLYPAVITLLAVTGYGMVKWMVNTFVFSLIAVFLGWAFIYRKVRTTKIVKKHFRVDRETFSGFAPLLTVIVFAVLYKTALSFLGIDIQSELVIIPAVLLGILVCLKDWKKEMNPRKALNPGRIIPLAILIMTIMGYKKVIEDGGVAQAIALDIQNMNFPVIVVFTALPFIAGVITGIAIGFIGASFPLIIDMLGDFPQYSKTAVLVLSFGFGYAGMMLSPFHACILLSKEYFCSSWKDIYKYLAGPVAFLTAAFVLYYFLVSFVLNIK
ncbi:DUF401 family protein [candidate division WOR-3 bacterium]|nr:DUF401 family protein [candidate division WOR-3 bacterium]